MAQKKLSKVQYGLESTHGTAVAADTLLYCTFTPNDTDREIVIPDVDMGVRVGGFLDLATMRAILAEGTLEDAAGAYYEIFPLLLSMCLDGNVTPTEQTAGEGDYLWTHTAPLTGAEDVDSITLEFGDDAQAYEFAYGLCRELRITFDCVSGEVHFSADLFGDRIIQTTFTGGISPGAAELIDASLARLYVDDAWANLGTTELSNALVSGEIVINGGVHPKRFGSAQREFDSHGQGAISATANLVLERTSAVAAEELKYRPASSYAPTMRALRLQFIGTQIGAGENRSLTIDMMGTWTSWQPFAQDIDGNTQDAVVFMLGYDDTASSDCLEVKVSTTTSAI